MEDKSEMNGHENDPKVAKQEEKIEKEEKRIEERLLKEEEKLSQKGEKKLAKEEIEDEETKDSDIHLKEDHEKQQEEDSPYNKPQRVVWKIIIACVLIILIVILGVWECKRRVQAEDEYRSELSFSDMNYLDEKAENTLEEGELDYTEAQGYSFKVVSDSVSFPLRLKSDAEGMDIKVLSYSTQAFVDFSRFIPDRNVKAFMDYLEGELPSGTFIWNFVGSGVIRVDYPNALTPNGVLSLFNEGLDYLVTYLKTYLM